MRLEASHFRRADWERCCVALHFRTFQLKYVAVDDERNSGGAAAVCRESLRQSSTFQFFVQNGVVVREANGSIIEGTAERSFFLKVNSRYSKFPNSPAEVGCLYPELQGHGISGDGDIKVRESADSISFKAAECIRDGQPEFFIQTRSNPAINRPSVLWCRIVSSKFTQIA